VCKTVGVWPEDAKAALEEGRRRLHELRKKRPRPHLDDKVITAWNGLMISAFARAYQVFGEPRYRETALAAAHFIRTTLWNEETGILLRSWREVPSNIPGFADDYAAMIRASLDLLQATGDELWLRWAIAMQDHLDANF